MTMTFISTGLIFLLGAIGVIIEKLWEATFQSVQQYLE